MSKKEMIKVEFITNNKPSNHLDYIIKSFDDTDEIYLATAFLKMSGLNLLFPYIKKHIEKGKAIQVIAGQHFGLTEPDALRKLHTLFLKNPNAILYLDKALNKSAVFHPKLFMFKKGDSGIVISGSANLTKGGLMDNQESSIVINTIIESSNWKDASCYFSTITSVENADVAGYMIINRYEQFYIEQYNFLKGQKVVPSKSTNEYNFSYAKLREHLAKYSNAESKKAFIQRTIDYKQAKGVLDSIIDSPRLTQKSFEDAIDSLVGKKGQSGLWKSGSLLRLRHKVYKHRNEFRELVKFIRDNQNLPASKVFAKAREIIDTINGARVNYVTEIMMTYQPERFANLNSNPIKVLKEEAGVYFKAHSGSFSGENYEQYCLLVGEICNELKLKNLLEADSFFNEIYWILKEENR